MKISFISGSGMGGGAKAANLLAIELSKRGHTVEALFKTEGCRTNELKNAGIKTVHISDTLNDFEHYLKESGSDIFHNHTSGFANNEILYRSIKSSSPSTHIVETNIFGRLLDFSDNNDVSARCFVSFTSGMQAFERTRLIPGPPKLGQHNVIFNPLPEEAYHTDAAKRAEFRKYIGVEDDEILCVRIGRPGPKWEHWECEAFAEARRLNSKLRLLLMEPKDSIKLAVAAGKYGKGIIIREADSNPDVLCSVYSSGDLMLQASSFGESYGYTLAEGMAAGMPIISMSTPWGDQAQTELIEHGRTGYICRTVKGMALALTELSHDEEKRKRFTANGIERIKSKSNISTEVDVLEGMFEGLVFNKKSPKAQARFEAWQRFIADRKEGREIECYEADHGMTKDLFFSSIYDRYRWLKHFGRFVIARLKGRKVIPLKW